MESLRCFPEKREANGKEKYFDLVNIDKLCVHDTNDMMKSIGYVEEGKLLYYHFKEPFVYLDFGLFALASSIDISYLRTYMGNVTYMF